MGDLAIDVAVPPGALHAEGPSWDAETGRLWWIDIAGMAVHCLDPSTGRDQSWPVPAQPGAVVLGAFGAPLVAMPEGLAALDPATGALDLRVPLKGEPPGNRANDAKVDDAGRLWLGTMSLSKAPGRGSLYRIEGDRVDRAVAGLTISNGPAFDTRRGRLYLADTALGIVDAFDLDPGTGEISRRRRFLDVHAAGLWPDGMTVDDDGMLWVALGRASAVHRYRPDGRLDGVVALPTTNPTSVAFGGPQGADLFVTTSLVDVEPEARPGQQLAGAVLRCRPGVRGPPAHRFVEGPTRRTAVAAQSEPPA